jgi:hypothetical protein
MASGSFIQSLVDHLVFVATDLLMPGMILVFGFAVICRALIYYTIKRQEWFVGEFHKRVGHFLNKEDKGQKVSFFVIAKRLLEKTFYELFEVRGIMKRRKPDMVMAMSDRVFLVNQGVAWAVRDILSQIRYLSHEEKKPKLLQISKHTLENNPCFSRVFGVVPIAAMNDVLNLLPGVLIICGIFGTFLGIMQALPELGNMDLTDVEGTKMVMDEFLLKVSFSMSTSIIGIILSVMMSFANTLFSPERLFVKIVDRLENSLDILWNRSNSNELPENIVDFDEHRDPLEALAEEAVNRQLKEKEEMRKSADKDKPRDKTREAS